MEERLNYLELMLGYEEVEEVDFNLVECSASCRVKAKYNFCYINFSKCPIYQFKLKKKFKK